MWYIYLQNKFVAIMSDATFLEVDDSIKAKNLLLFVSIGIVNIHIFIYTNIHILLIYVHMHVSYDKNVKCFWQDGDKDALSQMDKLMEQFDSTPSILVQPTPGLYNIFYTLYKLLYK